jgi:hypothetical protein
MTRPLHKQVRPPLAPGALEYPYTLGCLRGTPRSGG